MSYQLEPQLETKETSQLCRVLAALSSPEDIKAFLRDLLTVEELAEASRRFAVADLLAQGETYRAIATKTGVSTTTVTRIASWMHHGMGGYRRALQELSKP